ncbi:MAG: XamI family restriction endonuclease [Acidobacteria bacterium]|nr:XamI family restriction endonuclease [Acidobacteriota bacterium]
MPPPWTEEELDVARAEAVERFRKRRTEEPVEDYIEAFDQYQDALEELLEATVDLTADAGTMVGVVSEPKLLEAFRYLSGPPISEDDLKVLAEAVLTPSRLKKNKAMAKSVADVVIHALDPRRFPWVVGKREPTEAERDAAILASAALLATRRLETMRRNDEKQRQEDAVKKALRDAGLTEVKTREIPTLAYAPQPGQFCGESLLGDRKADIVVGLWDSRILPIECKVSNSATNSVKRLKNDAAVKAGTWRKLLGENQVVPTAVLSGVYKLHNLTSAQGSGLNLFWAHDLPQLIDWINSTKA